MKFKSENRKAMPKFLLRILGCMVLGILLGIGVSAVSGDWSTYTEQQLLQALIFSAPWLLYGSALLSVILVFLLYQKAKKLFSSWEEDDEPTLQKMDLLLSIALVINKHTPE